MHSKVKLKTKYPFFSQQALQAFYGDFRELFGKTKAQWIEVMETDRLTEELEILNMQIKTIDKSKRGLLEA